MGFQLRAAATLVAAVPSQVSGVLEWRGVFASSLLTCRRDK